MARRKRRIFVYARDFEVWSGRKAEAASKNYYRTKDEMQLLPHQPMLVFSLARHWNCPAEELQEDMD